MATRFLYSQNVQNSLKQNEVRVHIQLLALLKSKKVTNALWHMFFFLWANNRANNCSMQIFL